MPVELRNAQRAFQLDVRRIKRVVQKLLEVLGRGQAEVSILFVDNRKMRTFHRMWMGEDTPTDVLSFPQMDHSRGRGSKAFGGPSGHGSLGSIYLGESEGRRIARRPRWDRRAGLRIPPPRESPSVELLGDIVVSVETAARRAPKDVTEEILRYLIHGLLHLVGHDHVRLADRRRMNQESRRLQRIAHAVG